VLAVDCEMVGTGFRGLDSILASVCVVNCWGNVLFSSLVKPTHKVADYRTAYSGVTAEMLSSDAARPIVEVRQHVRRLFEGRIVIGHSVDNDFVVLGINHPAALTRDTAHDLRRLKEGRRPKKLKVLAADHLRLKIQRGEHDPAEDARASLYLYLRFRDEFEEAAARRAKRAARSASVRSYEPVVPDAAADGDRDARSTADGA
jgi:RNA exonuclease 4